MPAATPVTVVATADGVVELAIVGSAFQSLRSYRERESPAFNRPPGNCSARLPGSMLPLTLLELQRVLDQRVDRPVMPKSGCYRAVVDQRRLPAEDPLDPIDRR